jgi:hypothetical protein
MLSDRGVRHVDAQGIDLGVVAHACGATQLPTRNASPEEVLQQVDENLDQGWDLNLSCLNLRIKVIRLKSWKNVFVPIHLSQQIQRLLFLALEFLCQLFNFHLVSFFELDNF